MKTTDSSQQRPLFYVLLTLPFLLVVVPPLILG